MHHLTVSLAQRSYPILIERGLLHRPELLRAQIKGRHVLIVSDQHVAPLYLDAVRAGLADLVVECCVIPAGEREKNLDRFGQLMHMLAAMKASRDVTLIALGGGVIGDLTGFAAACWMRGVRFIQIPTTLLAMVDSSVGGKTAVDLPQGKNLVGAFHQPATVLIDTDTLATLPAREVRAGLAEVVKYGAIFDAEFFAWLEQHAESLLALDPGVIAEAIARSCQHKAEVVARDETEQGDRALLNFGHTFGHAIETADGYGGLLHGEAVAVGMLLAADLSAHLGLATQAEFERLGQLLQCLQLPTRVPDGLQASELLRHMRLDKKNVSGQIRLILWRALGQAFVAPGVEETEILRCLERGGAARG
ncbi:3-dehydroquinate synthase [Pseudomarimonas arenosa]|uniref:3-dehydroquinate synthase n=1 Tax=Pseudomarimonas arenosa TaxID=2774145 RepID=A0AAW3ZK64_9GAMM|nr:3-dehydroquinate synthase [Pseudomarimonas arenosa]MBD8525594.1 3-dehydroquinate synthase [Pseudomarimonas arenosa]